MAVSKDNTKNQHGNTKKNNNEGREFTPPKTKAFAPYNFVPLPDEILPSPVDNKAVNDEERIANYIKYIKNEGKLTGYIDLDIKTKTPCFIGGTSDGTFFSVNGRKAIYGSSLRGMLKNIFKIITSGAMRTGRNDDDFDDKVLYYRAVGQNTDSSLSDEYKNELLIEGGNTAVQAGFLVQKRDKKYYMYKTTSEEIMNSREVDANSGKIDWSDNEKIKCFTGKMFGKKRYTIHSCSKKLWKETPLEMSKKIISDYKNDVTRRGLNVLKIGKKDNEAADFTGNPEIIYVVPCFFTEKNNQIVHFGFGRYYRVPYRYSIGMHVPDKLKQETVDFADAMFGRNALWGSRVFFEDAVADKEAGLEPKRYSRVLATPNPTSIQLYLEQNGKSGLQLNTWNTETADIRGYKLYWHHKVNNNTVDWAGNKPLKGAKPIQPIGTGWKFKGRIRFEQLSEIELGALLKTLSLGSGVCYKIGQGKSLGLGSIKIDPHLHLTDQKKYYQKLISPAGTWYEAEDAASGMEKYINAFDAYTEENLKNIGAYRAFLMELTALLSWENAQKASKWKERIDYMQLKDHNKGAGKNQTFFAKRLILPKATEVLRE